MATEATEMANSAAQGAAHGGAEATGMPQLDVSTFPNQIFWLVITLVVLYLILSRIALPRISSVLADRQGSITSDVAKAEELKLQAQEAEKAYNQALADARTEAQKIIAEAKEEIKTDLDTALAEADEKIAAKSAESQERIAEIRESAVESAAEVARDTAKEIVSALGQKADARSVNAAVNARLKG